MKRFLKIPSLASNTKNFLLIVSVFSTYFIFTFLKFAQKMINYELNCFDTTIISWIQATIHPNLTQLMKMITFFGSTTAIFVGLLIISVLMILKRRKWQAMLLVVATVTGGLFTLLLKWIFQRQRPDIHQLIEETGYSFPSGHSMVSLIFYGMLAYFLILFIPTKTLKITIVLSMVTLIIMIGLSRIYLGVHYPSDVFAGFSVGGAWLMISIAAYKFFIDIKRGLRKSDPSNTMLKENI